MGAARNRITDLTDQVNIELSEMADGYLELGQLPTNSKKENPIPSELHNNLLNHMAMKCCDRREGSQGFVEAIGQGTSGAYFIGIQHGKGYVPLFVFKPANEEAAPTDEFKELFPQGEASVKEFAINKSSLASKQSTLVSLDHAGNGASMGVLTEFIVSEGTIQSNAVPGISVRNNIMMDAEKFGKEETDRKLAELETTIAEAKVRGEELGISEAGKPTQAFWDNCDPVSVQVIAAKDILYCNTDSNEGNVMITRNPKAIGNDKEKIKFKLVGIDYDKALPKVWPKEGDYNKAFYAKASPVTKPVDPKLQEKIKLLDVEKEIGRINTAYRASKQPQMTNLQATVLRAHMYFLKGGLERGFSLEELRVKLVEDSGTGQSYLHRAYQKAEKSSSEPPPSEKFWQEYNKTIFD